VVDPVRAREARRLATTPLTGEPFAPAFLRGAQLFHTSDDPRISSNRKVACASCHMNAELEGRSWAFETLPGLHGPRLTPSLRTLARTLGPRDPASGFGQLHRSGDRDELQDFEHTFRGPIMGGTGFLGVGAQPELGAPNAGRDGDLDAIATYLAGLAPVARSPARAPGGALGEAAVRGATFFRGADPSGHAADANCASCHVPETGFVDFRFHDVGAARPAAERELNAPARGVWQWKVNTKTLVNAWLNAPYDGVAAGEPESLLEVLKDLRGRPTHGHVDQLTGRQLRDLDELLRSIDGDLAAADVRGARDTVPPRVVRVEPASLTVVDVWFSESVERASAEALSSWRIVDLTARQDAPVTAATWDSRNGDRVTLRTQLQRSHAYEVVPGPILDLAATASGGVANRLVASAEETTPVRSFTVGDTLTVTLGGSGYENVTVRVHDSGVAGPGLPTWNHDSPVLFFSGSTAGRGFVRFDWAAPFAAVTGVVDPAALVDASVTLHPENGVSHAVEARRCLLSWSDPPTGGNWNQNAVGAPTWRDHAHPSGPWNQAGAQRRTAGVNGASVTDYNGANDVAFVPDAVAAMTGIHEPLVIAGPQVTEAFRFWLANPQVDYGFALSFTAGAPQATRFERSEAGLGEEGPVLRITYRP
jgi:hypothetical protein